MRRRSTKGRRWPWAIDGKIRDFIVAVDEDNQIFYYPNCLSPCCFSHLVIIHE